MGAYLRRGRRTGVDVVTSTLRSGLGFGFMGAGPGCHPAVAGMRASTLCLQGRLGSPWPQLGRPRRWAREGGAILTILHYDIPYFISNFCCLRHRSSSMILWSCAARS